MFLKEKQQLTSIDSLIDFANDVLAPHLAFGVNKNLFAFAMEKV